MGNNDNNGDNGDDDDNNNSILYIHISFEANTHFNKMYTAFWRKETRGSDVNMLCCAHTQRQTINLIVFGWQRALSVRN